MQTQQNRTAPSSSRLRRWGTGLGIAFIVMISALGIVLSISDWNFARNSVASIISSRLHRQVRIGGLTASLFTFHPRVHIENITVANPAWVGSRELAEIERIDIAIDLRALLTGDLVLESLLVDKPIVTLISDSEGRANFHFGNAEGDPLHSAHRSITGNARQIPDWPAIRQFTLNGGELYVRDEIHKLTFQGAVEADEKVTEKQAVPFKMRGEGTLNGEPFALLFKGGALANLRMDEPYLFEANVTAGKTNAVAKGEFARPFDFSTISSALHIKGENMAHLYYLTGLALPFTPPYRVAGELHSAKQTIAVHNLDGKIGSSDIKGELSVELAAERPKLIAKLQSKSLKLDDLSPALGKGIRTDPDGDALDSVAPVNLPPDKLFPTYQFQFDRLRSMDAEVTLQAASIQAKNTPFKEVRINLKLHDSVLILDPLTFTLPQGKIVSTVQVDARNKVAQNKLDVHVTDVQLDQFRKGDSGAPLAGVLQARLQLVGSGNSVHDLATTASGQLNAVIPNGEVRKAFAELTGINVANGLGLLLTKNQTRSTLRCGIAVVDIHEGNAEVKQLVFDTESVVIKGDGHIELGPEKVDVDIEGQPKKLRLARLRTPVTVNGTIRKPTIGIDAGDAVKQAGIAAALGSLLAPLTAALAFIDPGLAKDENCAALVAEIEKAQSLQASARDAKSPSSRVN